MRELDDDRPLNSKKRLAKQADHSAASHVDDDVPELGSLAQSARGKRLTQVRWTLIAIGVLTIAVNGFVAMSSKNEVKDALAKAGPDAGVRAELQRKLEPALKHVYVACGIAITLGFVFVVLGLLVKSFPVPITVASLSLYVLAVLGFGLFDPTTLLQGEIVKIIIIVGLAKAIQSAVAYEKENRQREVIPEF